MFFFRFPHTAHDVGAAYAALKTSLLDNTNASDQLVPAYRLGVRELSRVEVEQVAANLVAQILAKGVPFGSLSEFVNSGFLQAAIDSVPSINFPNAFGGFDIPKKSTAHLSQGDILQMIGHRLVARSDTFTIRAYGDVLDPLTNTISARAWVEATIQRIPNKTATADDSGNSFTSTGSAPGNFGREFRVVNLRWLTDPEI